MTPEEALKLLDHACSQLSMSRADHDRVKQATRTLDGALAKLRGLESREPKDNPAKSGADYGRETEPQKAD